MDYTMEYIVNSSRKSGEKLPGNHFMLQNNFPFPHARFTASANSVVAGPFTDF